MSTHVLPSKQLMQRLQSKAFAYFRYETNLENGLVSDKTAPDWPCSIAATGLGLSAYPVAVERGLMSHKTALTRTLKTLRFFRDSAQSMAPHATGYRGFYYHFLDMQTGRRAWRCELSTVDSALLFAGMLTAAAYFNADTAAQREVRSLAQFLYERADWRWAQAADGTIGHGWYPEHGFIPYRWQGYDEGLMLYMLALGSPSHAVPPAAYTAWSSTYEWKHCYDLDYLYCAPLFTHQLSQIWLDLRGVQDAFMRDKGIDYFENSRRATLIQQRYAIDNPLGFKGYGSNCWGITASDGPGPLTLTVDGVQRHFLDYAGRGAPGGVDDGTIAPWAVAASLPFAPDVVLPTLHHFMNTLQLHNDHPYGFKASFNQTCKGEKDASLTGWVSPYFFGLNLAPILLMVENQRSGMLWKLLRSSKPVVEGLRRAGFSGGWLTDRQRSHA